jgi:hypothetical protein
VGPCTQRWQGVDLDLIFLQGYFFSIISVILESLLSGQGRDRGFPEFNRFPITAREWWRDVIAIRFFFFSCNGCG